MMDTINMTGLDEADVFRILARCNDAAGFLRQRSSFGLDDSTWGLKLGGFVLGSN